MESCRTSVFLQQLFIKLHFQTQKPNLTWVHSLEGWKELASTLLVKGLKSPAPQPDHWEGWWLQPHAGYQPSWWPSSHHTLSNCQAKSFNEAITKTGYNLLVTVKIEPERKATWIHGWRRKTLAPHLLELSENNLTKLTSTGLCEQTHSQIFTSKHDAKHTLPHCQMSWLKSQSRTQEEKKL